MTASTHTGSRPGTYASVTRNTCTPVPDARSVAQAFRHVAGTWPARRALVEGVNEWTYAQLDALSDQAAFRLSDAGVARGQYVGLYMDRSASAVIAMLAILKLGAVYVPFDPAAPPERLASQVRHADIRLLIVAEKTLSPPWFEGVTLAIVAHGDRPVGTLPVLDIHPGELAYVIHTSGSTNEAKGVCVTHRAVLDLVAGASYCHFVSDDVVYHGMSIAFDGSTFEIWGALLSGACLVVAPPRFSIQDMLAMVETHAVSVLLLSTGLFNALSAGALRRVVRVRVLLAGGDVMSSVTASEFLDAGGHVLVNGYGPTEVTTFSHCQVMHERPDPSSAVPIGGPIPGTAAYVLDEHGAAVPVGVEGELCLSGTGLARGYLNDPAQTAERFVPDPFAVNGARMYRTGDLVRQSADGSLDYIGRIDTQVKIRGFRVELGEIEACLQKVGGFDDVCVIHVKNDAGTSRLHAFVVPRKDAPAPDAGAVLESLRDRLPEYMQPHTLTLLEALPLTINGKVDRRNLAARVSTQAASTLEADTRQGTSSDALANALLDALGQLLSRPALSPADHFFDAGGDSLSAMRFCALVAEEYGVELPLVALFDSESIADIVEQVRDLKASGATTDKDPTEATA